MKEKRNRRPFFHRFAAVGRLHVNVVRATVDALKKLEEPEEIAARRGMSLEEVAPDALLRARAEGIAEARKAREEAQAKAAQKDGE